MATIPDSIITAVTALLSPYGGIEALPRPAQTAAPGHEWLTRTEAVKYAKTCNTTLWRAVAAGELKQVKRTAGGKGGKVWFDRAELDAWIQGGDTQNSPKAYATQK